MNPINELQSDIAELQNLLKHATRPRIRELLQIEERKLSDQMTELVKEAMKNTASQPPAGAVGGGCYEVQLRNYAWDQTNNYVKLYVTLQNVQTLPAENIHLDFLSEKAFELHVNGLENKNYVLAIRKLLDAIIPEKSNWKVKRDMVIVSLAKKSPTNWSHITEIEKKASDAKAKKFELDDDDGSKDPGASLMNMMKNLYNSGDDEMKRTIEKSWLESQRKSSIVTD